MKQIMRGFVVVSLLSFAIPTIAQPIVNSEASIKSQSPSTPSVQFTADPKIELQQMLDAIFRPKAIRLSFRDSVEKGSVKRVISSGNMYYSNGELFVLYDKGSQGTPNTNFATINGKLYAWETGAKKGEILKRIGKDTEALLIYLIDIAGIKRSIYVQSYREKPNEFDVMREGDTKTILFRTCLKR